MKKFKVTVRWPKMNRIDEHEIEAEYYYKTKYGATTYNFVKENSNIAAFPARTTSIVEVT
tara:strand:- start:44 stop:223 length:180 start_codon:yes stop_codon:yes gene_type:complete